MAAAGEICPILIQVLYAAGQKAVRREATEMGKRGGCNIYFREGTLIGHKLKIIRL
jgi:hypothetical protein